MIVTENIEHANEILKKKFPPDSFFKEQDIIILSSEEIESNDMILLHNSKTRFVYVKKENIKELPEIINKISKLKSKSTIKKERAAIRYNQMRKELYPIIDELFNNDFYKKNLYFYESDFNYIKKEFRFLTNRVCKLTSPYSEFPSMIEHINNEYKRINSLLTLLHDLNLDFKDNTLLGFYNDFKINIFEPKFFSMYAFNSSNIQEKYINKISLPMNFYEQDIIVDLNISYNNPISENNDLFNARAVIPILEKFNFIKSIKYSEKEVKSFLDSVFDKIIVDNNLINNDLLLKDSIYENYLGKITNLEKRPVITLGFSVDEDFSEKKVFNKLKRTILKEVFDTNERRIAGFIRSVNRKVIQNVIEIDSFKDLFPDARLANRKIHFFCGETNSGKTYNAFEKACKHSSGLYAAPLRLLALEGQQEFEKRGKCCSMLTGEERDIKKDANFISSTVEMIDYTKEYDVAIIDEVQLLNDRDRGHAWFEAIVGINAKEIYLVGSEDIDKVLSEIMEYLGEKINKQVFTRKTKIQFDKGLYQNSLDTIGKLPPSSAVIAFSKGKVLKLKTFFEEKGNNVSVIYGALPPEVRRIETERFVNGETDVLISTDAIGMGLNLPIENIFFFEKEKYDGKKTGNLDVGLVKQIVGRAGRFNKFEIGYVSAMDEDTFDFIQDTFYKDSFINERNLKCSPNYPIIKQLLNITEENSSFKLLQSYNNAINFDFDIKNHMNECAYKIARHIDKEEKGREQKILNLQETVKIINAPVSNDRSGSVLNFFRECIHSLYCLKEDTSIPPYDIVLEHLNALRVDSQKQIELSIKKLDVISWMAFNFKEFNVIEQEISSTKRSLNKKLIKHLRN